jgi:transcriptional regulator with XRE-family HTH domain
MRSLAKKETATVIDRLRSLIESSDYSLRQLCQKTMYLEPPERIHHSTLSNILCHHPSRNLYLQQFLALLKLLKTTPEGFFMAPRWDAALLVVQAWEQLAPADRREILEQLAAKLRNRRSASRLSAKLSEHVDAMDR